MKLAVACVSICGPVRESDVRDLYLHGDAHDAIRGVPETDVSGVRPALRRPPRHHSDKELYEDEEDDEHVPGPEVGLGMAHALVAVAHDVEADREQDVENGIGVHLEADDCLKSVSTLAESGVLSKHLVTE